MNKKIYFGISAVLLSLVVGVAAFSSVSPDKVAKPAKSETYSVTLDKDSVPSGLTSSYQDNLATTITTAIGTTINVNIVNGRTSSGKLMELAHRGMIYNFANRSGYSELTGLSSVEATFTGSLSIRTARFGQAGGVELGESQALTSGSETTLTTSKYFEILAGDSGAVIDSLTLKFTCDGAEYNVKNLNGTYSGQGNDGYRYKLELNNGSATLQSLTNPTPVNVSGSASMNSATQVTCTLNSSTISYVISIVISS